MRAQLRIFARPDFTFDRPARPAQREAPAPLILDTSDREIIASVLSGDRERFHELVRRHAGPIWSTVRGSLRNAEDARDVFQETWLRAFERLRALRDPSRFRSWLLSIALNLVRQRQRRSGFVESEPDPTFDQHGVEDASDAADLVSRREEIEALRRLMERLPDRQREVLDLRLNHELSHGEIAELLGITPENSRANYYQALRKLRASVHDDEDDDKRKT